MLQWCVPAPFPIFQSAFRMRRREGYIHGAAPGGGAAAARGKGGAGGRKVGGWGRTVGPFMDFSSQTSREITRGVVFAQTAERLRGWGGTDPGGKHLSFFFCLSLGTPPFAPVIACGQRRLTWPCANDTSARFLAEPFGTTLLRKKARASEASEERGVRGGRARVPGLSEESLPLSPVSEAWPARLKPRPRDAA